MLHPPAPTMFASIDAPLYGRAFAVKSGRRSTIFVTSSDAIGCDETLLQPCPGAIYVSFPDRPAIHYPAKVDYAHATDRLSSIEYLTVDRGELPTVGIAPVAAAGDAVTTGICTESPENGYIASVSTTEETMRTTIVPSRFYSGCPVFDGTLVVGLMTSGAAGLSMPGPFDLQAGGAPDTILPAERAADRVAQASKQLSSGKFYEVPLFAPPADQTLRFVSQGSFEVAATALCAKADKGDVVAAYGCAQAFLHGDGFPRDLGRAMPYLMMAAAGNVYDATALVADTQARSTRESVQHARDLDAANTGDASAMRALAIDFRDGIGTPPDDAVTAYWLSQAAEKGNVDARSDLMNMLSGANRSEGIVRQGVIVDDAAALRLARSDGGLASGSADDMIVAARNLETAKDYAGAAPLYVRATKTGDARTDYLAAAFFAHHPTAALDSDERFATYLHEALRKGYWKATWLALFNPAATAGSDLTAPTIDRAMQQTMDKARSHDGDAEDLLALTYLIGRSGIAADCSKAISWAAEAAHQDDEDAVYDIGGPSDTSVFAYTQSTSELFEVSVLLTGAASIGGVGPDSPCMTAPGAIDVIRSLALLRRVGIPARSRLAEMYEDGHLVAKDLNRAAYWYRLNAKSGDVRSMQWLNFHHVAPG